MVTVLFSVGTGAAGLLLLRRLRLGLLNLGGNITTVAYWCLVDRELLAPAALDCLSSRRARSVKTLSAAALATGVDSQCCEPVVRGHSAIDTNNLAMSSLLKLRHIARERVVVRTRAPRLVRRTAADSDRSHSFSRTELCVGVGSF